ncbi:MAG: SUMF1/EgtB/PvdO family nonheme iron enzyme [Cyanobacteria bacterium P01_F01_bin.53]
MSRIFISYRRNDSIAEVGRIYDHLSNHFGQNSIFMDTDDIDAGDDFREQVTTAVGQCQILLVVIGKNWLQAKDAVGNRRLDNPADWVRLEIETALTRNIRVIPVLLTGAEMPAVQNLPTALQPLAYRNAAQVRHNPDFRRDIQRVVGVIEKHFDTLSSQPESPPPAPKPSVPARLGNRIRRRRVMQILGFTGGGLGTLWLGNGVLQPKTKISEPNISEPDEISEPNISEPDEVSEPSVSTSNTTQTAAELRLVQFDTVTVDGKGETINQDEHQAHVFQEKIGEIDLDLVLIPGGTFRMGSPELEVGRFEREGPQHEVRIEQPFLIGQYEVTQAQWRAVAALDTVNIELKPSPATFKGDNRPVESVNWNEAVEFCQRLKKETGRDYHLPSEAEWEYACRANTTTPFHVGETITTDLANYRGTDDKSTGLSGSYGNGPKGQYREETKTMDVGSFPANAFGLYDMHGNVWEWCEDPWHPDYKDAPTDGSARLTDDEVASRVFRGGAWKNNPVSCRSAHREYGHPIEGRDRNVGFRVSCRLPCRQDAGIDALNQCLQNQQP